MSTDAQIKLSILHIKKNKAIPKLFPLKDDYNISTGEPIFSAVT